MLNQNHILLVAVIVKGLIIKSSHLLLSNAHSNGYQKLLHNLIDDVSHTSKLDSHSLGTIARTEEALHQSTIQCLSGCGLSSGVHCRASGSTDHGDVEQTTGGVNRTIVRHCDTAVC